MRICLCAGSWSSRLPDMIGNDSFDFIEYPNISVGLETALLTKEFEMILILDEGFILDGRQVAIDQVFQALVKVAGVKQKTEIVIITKTDAVNEVFYNDLHNFTNARIEVVSAYKPRIISDIILGKSIEKKKIVEEVVEAEPLTESKKDLNSLKKKEKKREKVVEEKPKKKKGFFGKEKSGIERTSRVIKDNFLTNKVIICTGNPNSGTTSTAYNIGQTLSENEVQTIMVDLDIYTKGLNLYNNGLDSQKATVIQKNGLLSSFDDLDKIDKSIYPITTDLHLLGTTSNVSWKVMNDKLIEEDIRDLINFLRIDYSCTLVHIPIDILLSNRILIEIADNIIYCTEPTINGIMTIDRYLTFSDEFTSREKNILRILHKRLKFVFCNAKTEDLTEDSFLTILDDVSACDTLQRPAIATITHSEKFNDFDDTKYSVMKEEDYAITFYNLTAVITD